MTFEDNIQSARLAIKGMDDIVGQQLYCQYVEGREFEMAKDKLTCFTLGIFCISATIILTFLL